jgi:hypothetical protein
MKIKRTISLKVVSRAQRYEPATNYLEKAISHKYLYRIPKKTGKGWNYIYQETFLKPFHALKTIFSVQKKTLNETYEKNNIKKEYGADKQTFAAHVLEYFSNKLKWDRFFSKKENRDAAIKPVKMKIAGTEGVKLGSGDQAELSFDNKPKKADTKISLNRSLMRKIYNIYNKQ